MNNEDTNEMQWTSAIDWALSFFNKDGLKYI